MESVKAHDHGSCACGLSRRTFLGGCLSCAAGISALSSLGVPLLAFPTEFSAQSTEKARIRLIFAYPDPTKPNWPNIGYDFKGRIQKVTQMLQEQCPAVEFLPVSVDTGTVETANKILAGDSEVDGYIVYLVGCLWGDMSETIAASGKPTIFVDDLFAGTGDYRTT
ncbi:hypothetical protein LLG96_17435 [bacterium]|nr:hypothetical protein [bacterium]